MRAFVARHSDTSCAGLTFFVHLRRTSPRSWEKYLITNIIADPPNMSTPKKIRVLGYIILPKTRTSHTKHNSVGPPAKPPDFLLLAVDLHPTGDRLGDEFPTLAIIFRGQRAAVKRFRLFVRIIRKPLPDLQILQEKCLKLFLPPVAVPIG